MMLDFRKGGNQSVRPDTRQGSILKYQSYLLSNSCSRVSKSDIILDQNADINLHKLPHI